MSRRDWAKLAMVVFGVSVLYSLITYLYVVYDWVVMGRTGILWWRILWIFTCFVLGIALLYFSDRIAARIFPESVESARERSPQPLDRVALQELIFVGIGVYVLATTVPRLLGKVFFLAEWLSQDRSLLRRDLVVDVVKTAIGLYLIVGARGLTSFIHKFKYYGLGGKSSQAAEKQK